MTELDCLSPDKQLQVALYSDVMTICKETLNHIGLNMTQSAMVIIGDLVYNKLSIYGLDLEAFANHANRTFVDTDDVRLLVRRNPSLKARLQKRRKSPSNITSKKRKIDKSNNNLPSTSSGAPPIL